MWTTLALMAALSAAPDQAGQLTLANVRVTYGSLGAPRTDNKLLPGDQVHVGFDIVGVTADATGKVLYGMTTEVLDAKGKLLFKQEPRDLEAVSALGGNSLPAFTHLDVGLDSPAGQYTVKVTVTDRASKRSGELTRQFQVLPKGFGLVRLTTTSDADGRIAASVFEPGASVWVNCGIVGFERKANAAPNVSVELRVLDEKGQPTMAKPFTGEAGANATTSTLALPIQFHLGASRPGKFTVELKATDRISQKTSVLTFPLTVVASK